MLSIQKQFFVDVIGLEEQEIIDLTDQQINALAERLGCEEELTAWVNS